MTNINRLGSLTPSSIHQLQAQQAFRPKSEPAANVPGQRHLEPEDTYESTLGGGAPVSSSKAATSNPLIPQLPIQEIQAVAKRAGYVGLSDRDIQRAYVMGESLLADYRV